MNLTIDHYELIERTLDGFDFHKVQRVMDFLDWKLAGSDRSPPDVFYLRKVARNLLKAAIGCIEEKEVTYNAATAGFLARACLFDRQDGDSIVKDQLWLALDFTIEGSETNEI